MELVNPVSGATPAWDGFWHLVTPQVVITADVDVRPTIKMSNPSTTDPYDLTPQSSYDITPDEDSVSCTGGLGTNAGSADWLKETTNDALD